jgi:GMP synthase (glutamine-hydrolysing)
MATKPAGDKILILDFGSQYTQVIARRVRECQVYSEIIPYTTKAAAIAKLKPAGIILSGGPASVYAAKAPQVDRAIYKLGIPVLGICYGMQLIAHGLGGKVERSTEREYGPGKLKGDPKCALFHKLPATLDVWNSHGDKITQMPVGFRPLGRTENSPHAVIGDTDRNIYGLQFHPEVVHTPRGSEILANFVHRICGCKSNWTMESFIDRTCREIREQVGDGRVILGLSGGVDSSVAAALIHKAVGDKLTCIFVNNGLLRANEAAAVEKLFAGEFRIRMRTVDASDQFLKKLKGVTDPEKKRKIIGAEFIKVFEAAARDLKKSDPGHYRFLAQGTLYPDVIESVSISGNPAALIKSHHNVGGLPERMKFELPFLADIPYVGEALFKQHPMVYLVILFTIALSWFFNHSRMGLVLRAVGESPQSAHALGYPVRSIRLAAVVCGGAMCGCGINPGHIAVPEAEYPRLKYMDRWLHRRCEQCPLR